MPLVAHNQGIMSNLHHQAADWGPAAGLQPEQLHLEAVTAVFFSFLPVSRFPGPRYQRQICCTGALKWMQPRNLQHLLQVTELIRGELPKVYNVLQIKVLDLGKSKKLRNFRSSGCLDDAACVLDSCLIRTTQSQNSFHKVAKSERFAIFE